MGNLLYAKEAQRNGNTELASLFAQAAKTERFQHFAEEAELAGLVGDNPDNLKDAIEGESYEVDTMYRKFAEQAKASQAIKTARIVLKKFAGRNVHGRSSTN